MEIDVMQALTVAGAPMVIWALVQHIKLAVRAFVDRRSNTAASAYPLLADAVGALWALGLHAEGRLPDGVGRLGAVMVGVALGIAAGKVRDLTQRDPEPAK